MLRSLCALVLLIPIEALPCTTFLVTEPSLAVGKSYDWHMGRGFVLANKKNVKKRAMTFDPKDRPAEWTSRHASLTFNQYGRELPNGGINDEGLVIEIMWLDASRYPPPDDRPTVNELQWIQYQLDNFTTVAEVMEAVPRLRIAPASGRVHYLACDSAGECAAFEHVGGVMLVTAGDDLRTDTLTNNTYAESKRYLEQHQGFGGKRSVPKSTSSLDRFVRAASLARESSERSAVDRAFQILESVQIRGYSKWNIVYEPKERRVHFRTDARPTVRSVSLAAFDGACTEPVRGLDLDSAGEGDVAGLFQVYDDAKNSELVAKSLRALLKTLPDRALEMVAAYPKTTACDGPL